MVVKRYNASLPLLLITAVISFVYAGQVLAEFRCESLVSIKVRRIPSTEGGKADTAAAVEEDVPFGLVEAVGAHEDAAKAELKKQSARQQARAREICAKQFENVAGCLSSKLESKSSLLRNLDFDGRKALQQAFADDCKKQQGACGIPSASEPKCAEAVSAAAASPSPEAGKGKDAKKK